MVDIFMAVKLCASKSDARRLIQQGGAYINGSRISNLDQMVTEKDVNNQEILLRAGKKKYHRIILTRN
jgi:tyrosyl-tRNA synthetase